jgi:glucose 1-dehydrogenase
MTGPASLSIDGRVAIVTGAAGGMGSAVWHALAAAGAAVVGSDLNEEVGLQVAQAVRDAGGTAEFVAADVSNSSDVAALVGATVELYGRLDCAVNAAAIEFEDSPLADTPDDDFDRMIAVNLRSVFLCMKHEIKAMLAAGNGGAIVNIASTNAFRPQVNQPAYTAGKHGVIGLTKSAALDYTRHGIRVNAIAPGAIDTPMLHQAMARWDLDPDRVRRRMGLFGRFGEPTEIAQAALWLCSDASSFTTGHTLAVDGGFLAY